MTSIKLLEGHRTPADRQKERLHRMTQVVQSFASGFTLRPITVKLVTGGQAPAFSSSDRIWFHEGMMSDLETKEGVASLKGLTLHEIAHILLSPRTGSEFRMWLAENDLHKAWNALEDQRIESQIIASYPSTRDWFEATMNEYLLKSIEAMRVAFPLIHGRKYLSAEVRSLVKHIYINQQDVAELSDIIDQYRSLDMTNFDDIEIAKSLVERYHALTKDVRMENPHGHDHRSESEHETNANSKPWTRKQQKSASDKVKSEEPETEPEDDGSLYDDFDFDEPESDEETDPSESGDGDQSEDADDSSESDTGDEAGADDESGDESESGDQQANGESSSSDGDVSENAPASSEASKNAGIGDGALKQALEDLLTQRQDEALERLGDKIQNDINLYRGNLLLEGEVVPEPARYPHVRELPVSAEAVEASDKFAYELKALRAQHDPAWNRRVASGRINPVRWEQGCEIEEAFDRFDMGREDVTDIEAVVLLDVSGSMGNDEKPAHESMWALKHALDGVQASTSVVAYSDGGHSAYTLYSSDEEAGGRMNFIPNLYGTDPTKALQYAQGILANSKRAIKLLIIITDGEWNANGLEASEEIIRNLRDSGVLTSLAWLCSYDVKLSEKNLHGAEVVSHVRNASDLFHLGRSIVEVGINRQLVR